MLFKEIIGVSFGNYRKPTTTKYSVTDCKKGFEGS
jgi:hypothetical protein